MKAIQISQVGGADVLKIGDVERPAINGDQAWWELSLSIIIIVTLSIIHFFNFDSIILKVQKSISLTVQTQQTNQKNSL